MRCVGRHKKADFQIVEPASRATPGGSLKRGLALKPRFVFQAVVARQTGDKLFAYPGVQNAAHVLARNPGHCCDVALANILMDEDAAATDVLTEGLRQIQQCPRDTAVERQEASRRHYGVNVAQPRCE